MHKGKCKRDECNDYRGMSLLCLPGEVYGKVLMERLMQVTERKVSEEQRMFRKGKGCVDQIFAIKMMEEEYLGTCCVRWEKSSMSIVDGCLESCGTVGLLISNSAYDG